MVDSFDMDSCKEIDLDQIPYVPKNTVEIADCCYSCVFSKLHTGSGGLPYILMCKKWRSKLTNVFTLVQWYNKCNEFTRRTSQEIDRLDGKFQEFLDIRFFGHSSKKPVDSPE